MIAIGAILMACGGVLLVRALGRYRSGLMRRRDALGRANGSVRRVCADVRDRSAGTAASAERMRRDGESWDVDMSRLSQSLREQRPAIERLTHGRLAMGARVAGLISKAAQIAFLWR